MCLSKVFQLKRKERSSNANIPLFDDDDWILPDPNEELEDDMCQEVHEERVALETGFGLLINSLI